MRNLLNGVLVYEEEPIQVVQEDDEAHKEHGQENGKHDQEKEERLVVFTKSPGGKWIGEFSPNISRNDVNRLRIAILSEFSKIKRKARLSRRVSDRMNKELEHVA